MTISKPVGLAICCFIFCATASAQERTVWKHDKGSFEKVAKGKWVEKTPDGNHDFEETSQIPQFIELTDKKRKITVRLFEKFAQVKEDKGQFKVAYNGMWGAADMKEGDPKTDGFPEVAALKGLTNLNLYNNGVAISPDATHIALSIGKFENPELGIVEIESKKVVKRLKVAAMPQPVLWSGDGSTIAAIVMGEAKPDGRKSQVIVWDAKSGEERAAIEVAGFPGHLELSKDGKIVAASGSNLENQTTARAWDVATKKEIFSVGQKGVTPRMAMDAAGKTLALGGTGPRSDQICLYDIATGKIKRNVTGSGTFALSQEAGTLVVWGYTEKGFQVTVWDMKAMGLTPKATRTIQGDKWKPDTAALTDEDHHLVVGGGLEKDEVRVYDLRTGKMDYSFPTAPKSTEKGRRSLIVRPTPDSTKLMTYGTDGTVRVWTMPFGTKTDKPK